MIKFTIFPFMITAVLSVSTVSYAELRNYEANYAPTNMFTPPQNPYPKPVWQEIKPYQQPKKLPTIQDGSWGIKDLSKQKKRKTGPKYQPMGQEQLYKTNHDPFMPDLSYPKPSRQQHYTPPKMQPMVGLTNTVPKFEPIPSSLRHPPKSGAQHISPAQLTGPIPQRPKPLYGRRPVQPLPRVEPKPIQQTDLLTPPPNPLLEQMNRKNPFIEQMKKDNPRAFYH